MLNDPLIVDDVYAVSPHRRPGERRDRYSAADVVE
jgi:hypothetical protein